MRLIDADALLESIEDWHDRLGGTMNPADWGIQNVLQSVMDEIIEAPEVDAVQVMRCRDCENSEPCPVAGVCYIYCNKWERISEKNGYCHCGAKMDEKEVSE